MYDGSILSSYQKGNGHFPPLLCACFAPVCRSNLVRPRSLMANPILIKINGNINFNQIRFRPQRPVSWIFYFIFLNCLWMMQAEILYDQCFLNQWSWIKHSLFSYVLMGASCLFHWNFKPVSEIWHISRTRYQKCQYPGYFVFWRVFSHIKLFFVVNALYHEF